MERGPRSSRRPHAWQSVTNMDLSSAARLPSAQSTFWGDTISRANTILELPVTPAWDTRQLVALLAVVDTGTFSAEDLARLFPLTEAERRGLALAEGRSRLAVTPYYASLIDPEHPSCPVRLQVVPSPAEAELAPGDLEDPLGEVTHAPARAVVHKYRDRVLLLVVDRCAAYCRHCTRRRITFAGEGGSTARRSRRGRLRPIPPRGPRRDRLGRRSAGALRRAARRAPLGAAGLPHVQLLRVATRAPVTNPMRITTPLAALLRRHAPLFVVTHFNHPKECTPEAREACERLVDHGVPVENQSVLLRGVNSSRADPHRPEPAAAHLPRAPLLPAPGRPRGGHRPPAHAARRGRRDPRPHAREHERAGGAAPRGRPPRRRRQGDAPAELPAGGAAARAREATGSATTAASATSTRSRRSRIVPAPTRRCTTGSRRRTRRPGRARGRAREHDSRR